MNLPSPWHRMDSRTLKWPPPFWQRSCPWRVLFLWTSWQWDFYWSFVWLKFEWFVTVSLSSPLRSTSLRRMKALSHDPTSLGNVNDDESRRCWHKLPLLLATVEKLMYAQLPTSSGKSIESARNRCGILPPQSAFPLPFLVICSTTNHHNIRAL